MALLLLAALVLVPTAALGGSAAGQRDAVAPRAPPKAGEGAPGEQEQAASSPGAG
jgi:hypothetical protein